jgi:RimJ/RimL family protein N-acetyltransferase
VGQLGILVHRDHRGSGVGTALLQRALAEARSKFELVYLSVFSVNSGALRLYQRFGFSVCGHLPRAVKRGGRYFDEERMVLEFEKTPGESGANR